MATVSEIKKVASALDSIAEAIEKRHEEFGIPEKVASDFAYRCDLLADCLDKVATGSVEGAAEETGGVVAEQLVATPVSSGGFSPEQIAKKVDGPLQLDSKDSDTLEGEFTQEEFSSLLNLLKGLSDGDDLVADDASEEDEESEESESSDADEELAEQLQKVAAQLRARGSKK